MVCALKNSLLLLLGFCLLGNALALPLDDSLSPRQQLDLDLVWKYQGNTTGLSDAEYNSVIAQARNVDTRLDTASYIGSRARIYIELPITIRGLANPSSLVLSWTTGGLFSAGRVTPGNRQQIYDGPVTASVMRDIINFTFELDARDLQQTLRLEPLYDIEIITP
ncbi:MAG TPA: hypothetical protein VET88_06260 [Gammaproteobacteria bacterium]|nr:hypothetical protein [Gammaproteobacteria bacterium]